METRDSTDNVVLMQLIYLVILHNNIKLTYYLFILVCICERD